MYKQYLPSKKFLIILGSLILALIFVSSANALLKYYQNKSSQKNNDNLALKASFKEFMSVDTDNDGLPDWEEALWKTDPKNPDTDGDGTSDGDEVKQNRDPLKANTASKGFEPNDKIDPEKIAADKKITDNYISLSNTDKLAQGLFSQYIATKKVGTTLTATDKENIVTNFIDNLPAPKYTEYTLKDFSTNNATDTAAIKQYGNQVAEIILKNLNTKTDDVYTIISNYASSEEENAPTKPLDALTPIITKNQATVSALLKLKVPLEAANGHLVLVNTFYKINQDLLSIKNAPKDIANTMMTLNQYDVNAQNLSNILFNLTQYILSTKYNIQYTPNEFGYKLFNGIILSN